MVIQERSKTEVEAKLSKMGDYVRIDYLDRILKSNSPMEVKKFAYEKLSGLYEDKGMFSEAAKNMNSLADISSTFKDKIQRFMKTTELFVKADKYMEAETAFNKALACGDAQEKEAMKKELKNFYFRQAEAYERSQRSNRALSVYEKMLTMKISEEELIKVKKKMLPIYSKLGKVQEYFKLKKRMEE